MNQVTISAKCTFRYALDLRKKWQLARRGGCCLIICPAPDPVLPVAFESDSMEAHVRRGWARMPGSLRSLTSKLADSISQQLAARSDEPGRIALAKAAGRNAFRELAARALKHTGDYGPARIESIEVRFSDEGVFPFDGDRRRNCKTLLD
jgi:hypothetical protein